MVDYGEIMVVSGSLHMPLKERMVFQDSSLNFPGPQVHSLCQLLHCVSLFSCPSIRQRPQRCTVETKLNAFALLTALACLN